MNPPDPSVSPEIQDGGLAATLNFLKLRYVAKTKKVSELR